MLKNILFAFLILLNRQSIAQVTLKNPLICNDQAGKFKHYSDGNFNINYRDGKFESWFSQDSVLHFYEDSRSLIIIEPNTHKPVNFYLNNDGINISFATESILIKDSTKRIVTFGALSLNISASNWTCKIGLQLSGYILSLGFDKFEKNWKWDRIDITKGSLSFLSAYNCFWYKGPESFIMQDEEIKYGITISNTFKNHKYIWSIRPTFYEDHKITVLSDFDYEYSAKGVFKKEKSIGYVKECGF